MLIYFEIGACIVFCSFCIMYDLASWMNCFIIFVVGLRISNLVNSLTNNINLKLGGGGGGG